MSNACAFLYLSPLRPGRQSPGHRQRRYLSLCRATYQQLIPHKPAPASKRAALTRLFALFESVLVGGRRAAAVDRLEGTLQGCSRAPARSPCCPGRRARTFSGVRRSRARLFFGVFFGQFFAFAFDPCVEGRVFRRFRAELGGRAPSCTGGCRSWAGRRRASCRRAAGCRRCCGWSSCGSRRSPAIPG